MAKQNLKMKSEQDSSFFANLSEHFTYQNIFNHLFKPSYAIRIMPAVFILEVVMNIFIVNKVEYTEIDWSTYAQQVEHFLNGTRDYNLIEGDTGPVVYPAGHLYINSFLYYFSNHGKDIFTVQCFFIVFYMLNLILTYRIGLKTNIIPPIMYVFMTLTSYRIHSIFVLRLFNDPLAMIFFYLSLNLFLSNYWHLGSLIYSFAVSIKMNILLFAPGLLILLLEQSLIKTFTCLSVCAISQILIGWPFLSQNPTSYLINSFNLGRIFLFKWTVNWKFLPENLFLNPIFHLGLLILHLLVIIFYFKNRIITIFSNLINRNQIKNITILGSLDNNKKVVSTLFVSNFIGICFSRSLHYQFYVWYYHQLPFIFYLAGFNNFLIWMAGMIILEICWNIYPSNYISSLTLNLTHFLLLLLILINYNKNKIDKQQKTKKKVVDTIEKVKHNTRYGLRSSTRLAE